MAAPRLGLLLRTQKTGVWPDTFSSVLVTSLAMTASAPGRTRGHANPNLLMSREHHNEGEPRITRARPALNPARVSQCPRPLYHGDLIGVGSPFQGQGGLSWVDVCKQTGAPTE